MAKTKVLLADHNLVVREGVRCLLEKESDIEIAGECSDGEETLDRVKAKKPDVVLLDFAMPKLNGIDAIRKIKEASNKTEIVILTGYQKRTSIREALNAGVSGYLLKTSAISDVIAAIRAAKAKKYFLSPEINADIIDTYLRKDGAKPQAGKYDQLTRREQEIFRMMAEGRTTNEIADALVISPKTVAKHRTNLMEKLEMKNTATLVRYAMSLGVVSPDADL
ncbi:MAG: response regulator [Thermodesulfobacteriota bacterium]